MTRFLPVHLSITVGSVLGGTRKHIVRRRYLCHEAKRSGSSSKELDPARGMHRVRPPNPPCCHSKLNNSAAEHACGLGFIQLRW